MDGPWMAGRSLNFLAEATGSVGFKFASESLSSKRRSFRTSPSRTSRFTWGGKEAPTATAHRHRTVFEKQLNPGWGGYDLVRYCVSDYLMHVIARLHG